MKAFTSLLTIVASLMTIGAISVRLWWSKPRTDPSPWVQDMPPKAPSWLRKLARVWLYVVAIGLTVGAIIIAIVFVIRIINISN